MTTLVFTHPACIDHDTGYGHPESPDRLRAVLETLRRAEFAALEWREAPRAEPAQLSRVHDIGHIRKIRDAIPETGRVELDLANTVVSPGSGEAALRAAGAVVAAVDAVATGEAPKAFCAVRPPGHHAEADRAMGFCLFNNVAVGAAHALGAHGFGRVAVVDFDVHHGNGTQAIFTGEPRVFYASTHQAFIFPNTPAQRQCTGNILNVALARGFGGVEFRRVMGEKVLPALDHFAPNLMFISAGFDAHIADPIGGLRLDNDDFAWVTREIAKVAARHGAGRVVSTLEGGYQPAALAAAVAAHVGALMSAP